MDKQLIILIIQIIIIVGAYLVGKYIPIESIQSTTAKIELIINYADKFVSWAKYFMKDSTGSEKMSEVIKQLKNIADKYHLDISEEELTAIAQRAYDTMKAEDDYNNKMNS